MPIWTLCGVSLRVAVPASTMIVVPSVLQSNRLGEMANVLIDVRPMIVDFSLRQGR